MQEKPQSERGKDMSHQMTFNLGLGLQHKLAGMDDAAAARPSPLEIAREAVIIAAQGRPNGTASADDAYRGLLLAGYTAADLGKAAGSIFTDKNRWEYTGRRRRSARVSNHGRAIRIWRLKDFTF